MPPMHKDPRRPRETPKQGNREQDPIRRLAMLQQDAVERAGLKHEPFKPGRYADYYEHMPSRLPPMSFMSIEEESIRGSSPGSFLKGLIERRGGNLGQFDHRTPQIRLIPKEQIGEYLLFQLNEAGVGNPAIRESAGANPVLRKVVTAQTGHLLAAVDWAEQTYGIRIAVDPAILQWLGKLH